MAKVKIELNREGVRELLQSQAIMSVCEGYANRARALLKDGYQVTTMTGKNRVNAEIAAVAPSARRDNSENNSILKALGAVRG